MALNTLDMETSLFGTCSVASHPAHDDSRGGWSKKIPQVKHYSEYKLRFDSSIARIPLDLKGVEAFVNTLQILLSFAYHMNHLHDIF